MPKDHYIMTIINILLFTIRALMIYSAFFHNYNITYIIEIIIKKNISETAILSEKSLSEAWLSKEDEEAFAYLQR